MAFKPKNANGNGGGNFENYNLPEPKAGLRKARVSLIVDLGEQNQEDFEDPNTKEMKSRKPCQQVAIFADLVNDVVDYGGDIGRAQYRISLNKSFSNELQGINFVAVAPKDADGKIISGKPWGFAPASVLTKLANAVEKPEVITSMDLEEFLGEPLMIDVEVKKTPAKNDKKDKDGKPVIYTNVNVKQLTKVPPIEQDDPENEGEVIEVPSPVAALKQAPRCVTFDNATVDDIKFLRASIIKKIKLANNYADSAMETAIKEYEAAKGSKAKEESQQDDSEDAGEQEAPPAKVTKAAPKKAAAKPASKAAPAKEAAKPDFSDMDDDVPFN